MFERPKSASTWNKSSYLRWVCYITVSMFSVLEKDKEDFGKVTNSPNSPASLLKVYKFLDMPLLDLLALYKYALWETFLN